MLKFIALFRLLAVFNAVLCGHGGRRGKLGPGIMGTMFLGPKAETVMCKPENMVDSKFDQLRAEIVRCHIDECAAQATDIGDIHNEANKMLARMSCSHNYRNCMKEKFNKSHGYEGEEEPPEDNRMEWKKKMKAKRACMKTAVETVFGPIE